MIFFLTGDRQIGKSTLIRQMIEEQRAKKPDLKIGGFYTKPDGEDIRMFYAGNPDKSFIVGKRKICGYEEAFNTEGVALLESDSTKKADLIIMDELGWMESSAAEFSKAVLETLDYASKKNIAVFGVLRKDCNSDLINSIKNRSDVKIKSLSRLQPKA